MFNDIKRALVLAPHTDDGELGLGGTISLLVENSVEVTYVAFSTARQSVPEGFPSNILSYEVKEATRSLGIDEKNLIILDYEVRKLNFFRQDILEDLIKIRNQKDYDIVFVPSSDDVHQDHKTICQEGYRAFKTKTILGYELIWNNKQFRVDCAFELSKENLNKKIEALTHYKSQGRRNYLSSEFIRSLAVTRGVQFGFEYAEVFEVLRLIVRNK
tara:strand:- start:5675 stop:6319 length:645 start_codon:yes stop_codon:yes gene_type:complete